MNDQSVKSLNPFKSVILTIDDIIKAHGGQLRVESEEGKGTTFIISLPFKINHIT
jgi:signal transduction histidine kinase